MTLVDDLKAARALIDTPEKWSRYGSMADALNEACGGDYDRRRAVQKSLGGYPGTWMQHRRVISNFDRAIANAEQKP